MNLRESFGALVAVSDGSLDQKGDGAQVQTDGNDDL